MSLRRGRGLVGNKGWPGARVRFERSYIPEPNSGCWLWEGASLKNGYGTLQVEGKTRYAHRFSYEMHVGPIAPGLEIDHLCRNRACCNPSHLEAVTRSTNVKRGLMGGGPGISLPGELHPMVKLTREQAEAIRSSMAPAKTEARFYGISATQVTRIRRGLSWKCLGGK